MNFVLGQNLDDLHRDEQKPWNDEKRGDVVDLREDDYFSAPFAPDHKAIKVRIIVWFKGRDDLFLRLSAGVR